MVVLINGSLGVGKTSVAHHLLWSHPHTVSLEGDALCNTNPFDAYDQNRIDAVTNIFVFMVIQYQKLGYRRFVVDTIFEKVEEVRALEAALRGVDPHLSHYLLVANDQKREQNIRRRNRENFVWELQRSRELQGLLLKEFQGRELVTVVDASDKDVGAVGESILRELDALAPD